MLLQNVNMCNFRISTVKHVILIVYTVAQSEICLITHEKGSNPNQWLIHLLDNDDDDGNEQVSSLISETFWNLGIIQNGIDIDKMRIDHGDEQEEKRKTKNPSSMSLAHLRSTKHTYLRASWARWFVK